MDHLNVIKLIFQLKVFLNSIASLRGNFFLVANMTFAHILIVLLPINDFLFQRDVKNAFLNRDLYEKTTYIVLQVCPILRHKYVVFREQFMVSNKHLVLCLRIQHYSNLASLTHLMIQLYSRMPLLVAKFFCFCMLII